MSSILPSRYRMFIAIALVLAVIQMLPVTSHAATVSVAEENDLFWFDCGNCPDDAEVIILDVFERTNSFILGNVPLEGTIEESDLQGQAVHGVAAILGPAKEYEITFSYDLNTWDAYQAGSDEVTGQDATSEVGRSADVSAQAAGSGYWDAFSISVSQRPYWELTLADPISTTNLPGLGFIWGGQAYGDGVLDHIDGQRTVRVPADPRGINFLNIALDTRSFPNSDKQHPSWGSITIKSVKAIGAPNPGRGRSVAASCWPGFTRCSLELDHNWTQFLANAVAILPDIQGVDGPLLESLLVKACVKVAPTTGPAAVAAASACVLIGAIALYALNEFEAQLRENDKGNGVRITVWRPRLPGNPPIWDVKPRGGRQR